MMARDLVRATVSVWAVAMTAAASAQTKVPDASSGAGVQGFSVVLVAGALQASGERFAGDLPRGATKALSDMTDFLPYRSYRLLDSSWVLSSGSGRMTSRMRGPDNRAFDVILQTSPVMSRVDVRFALRDAEGASGTDVDRARSLPEAQTEAETASLKVTVARLEAELQDLRTRLGESHPAAKQKSVQVLESKRRLEMLGLRGRVWKTDSDAAGRIIDTSFTMDAGETVVVGTSRLQGDTALIVLLTAVPRATK